MPNSDRITSAQMSIELNARLDRIEKNMDRMSDAIVTLARAEEKILTLTAFSKQQSEEIKIISKRMDSLEDCVRSNSQTITVINKFFWLVMAATTAAVAAMYFN